MEVHRERLQTRGLPDADCAILFGVSESAVRKADAPGREPGRGPVPRHASVDIGVAVRVLVALELQSLRPVPVAATLGSLTDALQVECGQSGCPVVVDLGMDLARLNRGKITDPVAYRGELGIGRTRSVGPRRECDRPVATGEQEEPAPALRHTVPLQRH